MASKTRKVPIIKLVENMAKGKKNMFAISLRSYGHKLRRKRPRIILEGMPRGVSITVKDEKFEGSFFLLRPNVTIRLLDIAVKIERIMRKRDVDVIIVE